MEEAEMRRLAIHWLFVLAAVATVAGCSSSTSQSSPSSVPTHSSATSPSATPIIGGGVAIEITGTFTQHLAAGSPIPCSMATDNSGGSLLRLDFSAVSGTPASQAVLGIAVAGYHGKDRYNSSAVWAADGATSVYFDPAPDQAVISERYVAGDGTINVTSASASRVEGDVTATLHPESTGSGTVSVNGTWRCALS
jgi:hypothetical protein